MSGILHVLFGLILGLAFLRLSGNNREKRGWNLGLFFIFVINNWFGPDLRGFVKRVFAIPFQSETLYKLSESIHSYSGWIVWAFIWAPLWYSILKLIQKEQQKRVEHNPDLNAIKLPDVAYSDVFLAVLIGGFCHLFVDMVGHVELVGGTYQFLGAIELFTPWDLDVILCYVILAAAIIGGILFWKTRKSRESVAFFIKRCIHSPHAKKILIFVGIALGNALLLYGGMAYGNLVEIDTITFPWNTHVYLVVAFNLKNALQVAQLFSGSATWYTTICICAFITLFIIAYARFPIVNIRGKSVRLNYLIIAGLIINIICGYLLQPVIGNISGKEADVGGLVFLWAFLGFPLVTATFIHNSPQVDTGQKLD